MKKFVLTSEFLKNYGSKGYLSGNTEVKAVANDMNTLMKHVPKYIKQVFKRATFDDKGWDVTVDGTYAELTVKEAFGHNDAVHFAIKEVDFLI